MARKHKRNSKEVKLTVAGHILIYLLVGIDLLPRPFEHKTAYVKRIFKGQVAYSAYWSAVQRLERLGLVIEKEDDNGNIVFALTEKGRLEALFEKAKIQKQEPWDGKWRLMIFDIPEKARHQRRLLRYLLRKNQFVKLQESVFISPYALNVEAIAYLKETGLNVYIRLLRVDQMDDDKDLCKKFGL